MYHCTVIICLLLAIPRIESHNFELPYGVSEKISSLKENLTALQHQVEKKSKLDYAAASAELRNLTSIVDLEKRLNTSQDQNLSECSNLLNEKIGSFLKFASHTGLFNSNSDLKELQENIANTLKFADNLKSKVAYHMDSCLEANNVQCLTDVDYEYKIQKLAKYIKYLWSKSTDMKFSFLHNLSDTVNSFWSDNEESNDINGPSPNSNYAFDHVNLLIVYPVEDCIKAKSKINSSQETVPSTDAGENEDPSCVIIRD